MNKKVVFLTDYKGYHGSKYDSVPYESGMDLEKLSKGLLQYGIEAQFLKFSEVYSKPISFWDGLPVFYTSSEDIGYYYKSFIEDVIFYLELNGALLVPEYRFLRANNNKVFMEFLRKSSGLSVSLKTHLFGTLEELLMADEEWVYPVVIKLSEGAMSETVDIANSRHELIRKLTKMTLTTSPKEEFKEFVRKYKYPGYIRESRNRKKFILQEFVPGLNADFKILNFGDLFFCFKRPTRRNDFRASGSGNKNYLYGIEAGVSDKLLDYAKQITDLLKTPFLSMDIVDFNGVFHLLEFQAVYFGTVGVIKSKGHYEFSKGSWEYIEEGMTVEETYIHSIGKYLNK